MHCPLSRAFRVAWAPMLIISWWNTAFHPHRIVTSAVGLCSALSDKVINVTVSTLSHYLLNYLGLLQLTKCSIEVPMYMWVAIPHHNIVTIWSSHWVLELNELNVFEFLTESYFKLAELSIEWIVELLLKAFCNCFIICFNVARLWALLPSTV